MIEQLADLQELKYPGFLSHTLKACQSPPVCDTTLLMPTNNEPWTVLKLLDWTRGHFEQTGVESPRLCAEVLLGHCLDCPRVQLYARFDYHPTPAELAQYRQLVRRAAEGEPVAYLVGKKEFYSLEILVTPDVLIPRPETEMLVDQAIAHLRNVSSDGVMWDVCTGSGCVAVAVARHTPHVTVLATDISRKAVQLAGENAARYDLSARVTCTAADLLTVPAEWTGGVEFDVITANPPYVADGDEVGPSVKFEPQSALLAGPDGLDVLRPLIAAAPEFLKSGGILCLEFGAGQADDVRNLLVATSAFEEPTILRDHQNLERTAVAKKK